MRNIPLTQIKALIAVCEEGSFTRAAARENSTQSGISQHVAKLETALGAELFTRTGNGAVPTPAGRRFYGRCVEALAAIDEGAEEVRARRGDMTGHLRIGLMPTFTRAVLPPVLETFMPKHPGVAIHVVEGYSGLLTEMVIDGRLDFAIVPAGPGTRGLKTRLLVRERETLLSGPNAAFRQSGPVRLSDLGPLKLIVPGPQNRRRELLETYLETHRIEVAERLEMDAMIATLRMVASTDWVTILPRLICLPAGQDELRENPLAEPALHSEFVLIQPARRSLGPPGRAFLGSVSAELAARGVRSVAKWALPPQAER
jgi:DNA-binding transcriptional LysR family regulator